MFSISTSHQQCLICLIIYVFVTLASNGHRLLPQLKYFLLGYFTLNFKLACSVCYLKVYNFFFLSKELKNGIEISVRLVILLWLKTVKVMF